MDLASISAALGSIKTATDIAKFIRESDLSIEKAETKLKLADLISALADAKLEVVEAQQTLAEAQARVRDLELQLRTRENVRWGEPAYWLEDGPNRDGPFCQKCYDTESKLVRLQGDGNGYFECKACKSSYLTQDRRARDQATAAAYYGPSRGGY